MVDMALEPSERLFAGVVLIVVGFVGLVYRLTGYGVVIDNSRIYGGGYSLLSLIISAIFVIVVLLGMYIAYDAIRKNVRKN